MKLPRDLSGTKLASLLSRRGYEITRQTGSHLRLTSTLKGTEHHITIPRHKELRVGTLNSILTDVASYLEVDRDTLAEELFGR
ncbi:MAG: type II toxin-antitoxin system HicA family toxin [Dehalococcoidia bacterium]|nr:type II toxin-antitoxin system HicA family toxin [Dehalococcoidia bacterium]